MNRASLLSVAFLTLVAAPAAAQQLGDILTIGNGVALGIPGGELLTFEVIPTAVDDRVSD